jgi:hypothetical protein
VAAKGLKRHVALPTLLTGYGGFEVSLKSYYSGILGRTWLSRGGYVVANIRGGGKYGPGWRQATLKKHLLRRTLSESILPNLSESRPGSVPLQAHLKARTGSQESKARPA